MDSPFARAGTGCAPWGGAAVMAAARCVSLRSALPPGGFLMSTRQPSSARRWAAVGLTAVVALAGTLAAVLTSSPAASAATGCQVDYRADQWTGGFTGSVTVSPGSTGVSSWTVTWSYTGGQVITSAWNATVQQSGAAVTATSMSYNGSVPA